MIAWWIPYDRAWCTYAIEEWEGKEPIGLVEDNRFYLAPYHSYLELYGQRHYVGTWEGLALGPEHPPYNLNAWLEEPAPEGTGFSLLLVFEETSFGQLLHYRVRVDTSTAPVVQVLDAFYPDD